MPVYGLVVTLERGAACRAGVCAALEADPRFLVGSEGSERLPVALACAGLEEEEAALSWLEGLSGVLFVDTVFVDFSDIESLDRLPRRRRGPSQGR